MPTHINLPSIDGKIDPLIAACKNISTQTSEKQERIQQELNRVLSNVFRLSQSLVSFTQKTQQHVEKMETRKKNKFHDLLKEIIKKNNEYFEHIRKNCDSLIGIDKPESAQSKLLEKFFEKINQPGTHPEDLQQQADQIERSLINIKKNFKKILEQYTKILKHYTLISISEPIVKKPLIPPTPTNIQPPVQVEPKPMQRDLTIDLPSISRLNVQSEILKPSPQINFSTLLQSRLDKVKNKSLKIDLTQPIEQLKVAKFNQLMKDKIKNLCNPKKNQEYYIKSKNPTNITVAQQQKNDAIKEKLYKNLKIEKDPHSQEYRASYGHQDSFQIRPILAQDQTVKKVMMEMQQKNIRQQDHLAMAEIIRTISLKSGMTAKIGGSSPKEAIICLAHLRALKVPAKIQCSALLKQINDNPSLLQAFEKAQQGSIPSFKKDKPKLIG